jgi:hypothetical protein
VIVESPITREHVSFIGAAALRTAYKGFHLGDDLVELSLGLLVLLDCFL